MVFSFKKINKKQSFKIEERVLVTVFLEELQRYLSVYEWGNIRSSYISFQRETMDIPLRRPLNKLIRFGDRFSFHDQFHTTTKYSDCFPHLVQFLQEFAVRKNAILCRATIVTLAPKKQVYSHIDFGEYYDIRDRYHLVLSSSGSRMVSGGEQKKFVSGDLFYFNNHLMHEAYNDSDEERIHVIFDLLPRSFKSYFLVFLSVCKTVSINLVFSVISALKSKKRV